VGERKKESGKKSVAAGERGGVIVNVIFWAVRKYRCTQRAQSKGQRVQRGYVRGQKIRLEQMKNVCLAKGRILQKRGHCAKRETVTGKKSQLAEKVKP